MATHELQSWKQQALVFTSLLSDVTNFAATSFANTQETMTATATSLLSQITLPPSVDFGAPLIPNIYDPLAVNAQDVCPGYEYGSNSSTPGTFALNMLNGSCNAYGNDISVLAVTVEPQTQKRLHVNVRPAHIPHEQQSWYELPGEWMPLPAVEVNPTNAAQKYDLDFSWESEHFTFQVHRQPHLSPVKSDKETLFQSQGVLVYEDQFIEFVLNMTEGYSVYGLGEVIHGLQLQPGLTRTIFAADNGDPIDGNIYGSHPFLLETRYYQSADDTEGQIRVKPVELDESMPYTTRSHGMWVRNAHAQEIILGEKNITWRLLGGELDMYFFEGGEPMDVIRQYINAIGLPAMQQYWTFGYHQCRWGYENWTRTEEIVDNFAKFGIPLEAIWNDIDYMKQYRDFDNDPVRFGYEEGEEFLSRLEAKGQHYVPIVDAAIYIPNPDNSTDAYQVFDEGQQAEAFLMNPDRSLYIGAVWPGFTVFPDWLSNTNASRWWMHTLSEWHRKLHYSGIWIDMSEVSSFCVGSCGSNNLSMNPVHPPFKLPGEELNIIYDYPEGFENTNASQAASAASASSTQSMLLAASTSTWSSTSYLRTTATPGMRNIDHPPYVINNVQGDLAVHAVAPNATHHNGYQEYDVHNLYGHLLLKNTYNALLNQDYHPVRPFIIGRSTSVGSGQYAGHWGGDNYSKWLYMYFSIPQALTFSMFGIPMFGVDTCGFAGNSDEELCNRWMQLSAFFPFYRNHNTLSANSQEPYVWESVMAATKTAMEIRFQLLPYMYTLFYLAHTKGDPVMRALHWEFPYASLRDADRQFFLGPAILVTPVLAQGATTVNGVFPGTDHAHSTIYYDWYNQSAIPKPAQWNTTIEAPLSHIPVYIRGGNVLATQQFAMTTRDARKTDWSLTIALDSTQQATGVLYLDDGETVKPESTKLVNFHAGTRLLGRGITFWLTVSPEGSYSGLDLPLANITVLGIPEPINTSGKIKLAGEMMDVDIEYSAAKKRLVIANLQDAFSGKAWHKQWQLEL